MRFRLIDMWTVQVLVRMGVVNAGYARAVLRSIYAEFVGAAAVYENVLATGRDLAAVSARLAPLAAYVGTAVDAARAAKRADDAAAAKGRRPHFASPYYYPAAST
jgi:cytidylate kinase